MSKRRLLAASVLWGLASGALAQPVAPPDDDAADDPPIIQPAPDAPDTPGTVGARLAYAQSQAEAEGGDCAQRLAAAQAQRDLAAASPLVDLVVPAGRARLASIDYRLHLGRAYCGNHAAPRQEELRAALDAAQSAVSLFRQGYDYQSMAVMQYDVASTYRLLGDRDQAIATLTSALGMDAEFGFAADATENGDLLRRWQDQPAAAPAAVATPRSVTLKFAWAPAEAEVSLKADYLALVKGAVLRSTASAARTRHVRADGDGWILSSEPGERHYDFDGWHSRPDPSLERTLVALAAGQMLEPDIKVGATGDFKDVVDAAKTSGMVAGDIDTVTGDLSLPEEEKSLDLTALYGRSVEMLSEPDGLRAKAGADYAIATSTWIDATLVQGEWYDMTASLFVPAIAMWIDHDIQFAYSRPMPCTDGAAGTACAEILVHATPNADALSKKIGYMKRALALGQAKMRYESAMDLRLVVDPARLLPYASEVRAHWYLSIEGRGEPLIGSETLVSTYTYR